MVLLFAYLFVGKEILVFCDHVFSYLHEYEILRNCILTCDSLQISYNMDSSNIVYTIL